MSGSRCKRPRPVATGTLLLLLLFLPGGAGAWEFGGHLKNLTVAAAAPPVPGGASGLFSVFSQRLTLSHPLAEQVQAELAIENLLLYRDPADFVPLPAPPPGRLLDLERDWGGDHHLSDRLQVDRLALRGRHGQLDWSIGRQAIGFGRIVLASPLDVINPFPPDALDTDVRPGVDALRATISLERGTQVGATAVFDRDSDHDSVLLSAADTRADIDLLLLTGSLRSRPMLGLGAAGSLGQLGVKAEASVFRGRDVGRGDGDLRDYFWLGALEFWYRFDNGLILLAEGLYNGVGASDPARYPLVAASPPLQEGLSSLLGTRYLLLAPSWELHPLVTASALVIWNLGDGSALLRPQLAISLADNASLDLFYAATSGPAPRRGSPVPRSEFGSYADSGGILLRWYF